jgi:formylmethanofuran dehydrogenase subunit E
MDRLFKVVSPDKALEHGSIIFEDDFNPNTVQYGDQGINDSFETEETKKEIAESWKLYKSKCAECEKDLPKRYYTYEGKNLCTKCYKKEDTFINRIKLQNA